MTGIGQPRTPCPGQPDHILANHAPGGTWFGVPITHEPRPEGVTKIQQYTADFDTIAGLPTPTDHVNHPAHYTSHPSGVECIKITRHHDFATGNAIKYLWRAGLKTYPDAEGRAAEIRDLEKAAWYIADRIAALKAGRP
jgi:hypothetical protein